MENRDKTAGDMSLELMELRELDKDEATEGRPWTLSGPVMTFCC